MIHQVMLQGHIHSSVSPIISRDDIQRIFTHVEEKEFTGLTIYVDGSFLTLYEGDKASIEHSRAIYANTARYSNILTLFSNPIEKRDFADFRIGLGRNDCDQNVMDLPNCFCLGHQSLNSVFPASFPNEFQILIRTFARVNNLMAV
jgi:hypothetical protein